MPTSPTNFMSIGEILHVSKCKEDFMANIFIQMDQDTLSQIEMKTRGQSDNSEWFKFRKSVITGSKGHDVFVKMEKLKKLDGRCTDMYSLNEKISGRIFTSPDIPVLRYGRVLEPEVIEHFKQEFGKNHVGCGLCHLVDCLWTTQHLTLVLVQTGLLHVPVVQKRNGA